MKFRKPSPVYSLWLLLLLAMVIFVGLSLGKDLKIGEYTFSKAGFVDALIARSLPEGPEGEPVPSDTLQIPVETIVIEPDTTVHNVLVFGDSMTHNLAMSIARYGTKNNYKVTGVTWESSSIPAWRKSGKIKQYMEMSKPDFVIISLGSNEMELRNFERRIPDIQGIAEQMGDLPFVWVGPPLWKEDKGFYKALSAALPAEKIFKLEDGNIERGPDHVHPTRKGADQWADTLMRWIKFSQHPILTELPDSGTGIRKHKFIYLHPGD